MLLTPVKRMRRSRANSHCSTNTPLKHLLADYASQEEAGSDSDKSLSTNENTLPTASSGLNSADTGIMSPP